MDSERTFPRRLRHLILWICCNLKTVSQTRFTAKKMGKKRLNISSAQDSEGICEVTSVLVFFLMPTNESRTNRTKVCMSKQIIQQILIMQIHQEHWYSLTLHPEAYELSAAFLFSSIKKSVSIFIILWFISFSLKSPGTMKELVGLNVSWNVWGWWELCFVNLSPKPSDAHHAAEGELVCKSGWSRIEMIYFVFFWGKFIYS